MVCKLKKSLYGLKQAPQCWNKAFHDHMEQIGLVRSESDPCVYHLILLTLLTLSLLKCSKWVVDTL